MYKDRSDDLIHLICYRYERVSGWEFRVPPWFPNGPGKHFFSALKFGGMDEAYIQAKKLRDECFEKEGLPLRLGWRPTNALNESGVVGVMLAALNRPGLSRFSWVALWSDNKVAKKKGFSINKHGFETALRLAVQYRELATSSKIDEDEIANLDAYGRYMIQGYFGNFPYV